MPRKEEGDKF
ncbi:hypothetical protein PFDG_04620 [Plasmodium falciparum Dd2]|uniref:Uncharacterized protein n=1 Tax=Plasmodium falciparum (isolate Dd2) TaxID=57267 RepID=A0A0L7M5J4_PLAF4|nr:hypothetical protein PFDG_04620 [Plasmodium falciparum Dd2]